MNWQASRTSCSSKHHIRFATCVKQRWYGLTITANLDTETRNSRHLKEGLQVGVYPIFQPHCCTARCLKVPNLAGHFFRSLGSVAQILVQPLSPSHTSACCNCVSCYVAGGTHVFMYLPSPLSRYGVPPQLSVSIIYHFLCGAVAEQHA